MLANMVLNELKHHLPQDEHLHILITSTTPQGIEILKKRTTSQTDEKLNVSISYFPFDSPVLMNRAFTRFQPRLAVLVETELWPGFLITAKEKNIPVMVINGRLSVKSHRTYRKFSSFFHRFGPDKILAMSREDASRFADIVHSEKIQILPNLKFDKLSVSSENNHFSHTLFAENSPLLIFGSIRRQEEKLIISVLQQLLQSHPDLIIGFFPKHIARADNVMKQLTKIGLVCKLRSTLETEPAPAGAVIVWDKFGELSTAYQIAEAAFVGGSLCNWGGHNFLEPLMTGIRPITGPNWQHFAWIGKEIVETGLVEEVQNEQELVEALLKRLHNKEDKKEILNRTEKHLTKKRGGTADTCAAIMQYLNERVS